MFARELSEELEERGHPTTIVYLYDHAGDAPLPLRPQDRVLGTERRLFERLPGVHPVILARLLRHLDRFSPEIVQVNGSRSVKYGSLARRLRRGHWPLVSRVIGSPPHWAGGAFKRRLYARLVLSAVDGLIAVSSDTLQGLRSCYRVTAPATVVPRGVAVPTEPGAGDRGAARRRRQIADRTPVVVFIGSLTAEKRPDRLLRVFARVRAEVPDVVLWVAGDGPLAPDVRQRIEAAGLTHAVALLGVVQDVDELLAAADLLLLTSDTEGTPGVVLEAGAAGLPTVATSVGGVPACVGHGKTGLLAAPDDEEGLAAAVVELLRDPDRRHAYGAAARRRVEECFSLPRVADEILAFYAACRGGGEGGGDPEPV